MLSQSLCSGGAKIRWKLLLQHFTGLSYLGLKIYALFCDCALDKKNGDDIEFHVGSQNLIKMHHCAILFYIENIHSKEIFLGLVHVTLLQLSYRDTYFQVNSLF